MPVAPQPLADFDAFSGPVCVVSQRCVLADLRRRADAGDVTVPLAVRTADAGDVVYLSSAQAEPPKGIAVLANTCAADEMPLPDMAPDTVVLACAFGDAAQPSVAAWRRTPTGWQRLNLLVLADNGELFSRHRGLLETCVLRDRRAAVIGLGSGGSAVALELARAGVGGLVRKHPATPTARIPRCSELSWTYAAVPDFTAARASSAAATGAAWGAGTPCTKRSAHALRIGKAT